MTEETLLPGTYVDFPRTSARPAPYRSPLSQAAHWIGGAYLKLAGWKIEGDWPWHVKKMVAIVAPHTSNWDGVNLISAAGYYRLRPRFLGKASLTKGFFGGFMRWLGCIPVEKTAGNADLVMQMKRAFEEEDRLILALAPEGTRSRAPQWKTGYYRIAHGAGVPILMASIDYGTKTIRIGGMFMPTGDYEADYEIVRRFYAGVEGKHITQFSVGD